MRRLRVREQAVAVEALDVVALEGAAVAPDVDVVFLHRGHQHGAGDGAAQRRGVEVGRRRRWRCGRRRPAARRCLRAPAAGGSRSGAPSRRRTAWPCAGSRRSPARRAGPGWRCRRRGSRPSCASSAARRWCPGRRKRRCRPSGRREGARGWCSSWFSRSAEMADVVVGLGHADLEAGVAGHAEFLAGAASCATRCCRRACIRSRRPRIP